MIEIYTDGSCKPTNPGPAGYGYVIIVDGKVHSSGGNYIGEATNNIAEVKAIEHVLEVIKNAGWDWESMTLYTDSQYAVGLFTKNWKPKVNVELINKVKSELENFPNLVIKWVRGHDGNEFNEMADGFAKEAIDGRHS